MARYGSSRDGLQPIRMVGGVGVIKSSPGGLDKLRCPLTQQVATKTRRADGSVVYRTARGVEYVTRKF